MMNPIELGGGIKVLPLAFESFGIRGMATYVETDDLKLLIDPGSALGPRFNLSPHELEYVALVRSRERILDWARKAMVLTVSHYHFDHYVPFFENWLWIWSSPDLAERLYRGKLILAKDPTSNINPSQRRRGYLFWKQGGELAEMRVADGKKFTFGGTKLRFSEPLSHGPEGSQVGLVLMLTIEAGGFKFMHASDVQGPVEESSLELILREKPDFLIIGGPPLYLRGFRIEESDLSRALENMRKLACSVPSLLIDHHLLRSLDYQEFLKPAYADAGKRKHRLLAASELLGIRPELLEAKRKELHERKPIEREWYKKLERGEIKL
jgi:hypothetical protein